MRQALGAAALAALSSAQYFGVLKDNTVDYFGDIPLITKKGARDKQWRLEGQTGWSYVGYNEDRELHLQLALILTTKDNGTGATEKFEDDDIVNIAWAMEANNHTDVLAEYEAGFVTYYKGAPGGTTSTPSKRWSIN